MLAAEVRGRRPARRHLPGDQPQARQAVQIRIEPRRPGAGDLGADEMRGARSPCGTCKHAQQESVPRGLVAGLVSERIVRRLPRTVTSDRDTKAVNTVSHAHLRRAASPTTSVRQSGSPAGCNRKRDHGHLLFIDLRDHYGIDAMRRSRPIPPPSRPPRRLRLESVISRVGTVMARTAENVNPALPTGAVEVDVDTHRRALGGRDAAIPGVGHPGDSRRAAAALPLPRSAARQASTRTSSCDRRSSRASAAA